jgi:hypothetical protein
MLPVPGGVGGHDLVPPALDGVEQAQLGAGMRAFPTDQEPGPFGPAGRLEQAGDLADLGVFTQITASVEGGDPAGRGPDRFPDRFGDRGADTESDVEVPLAPGPDVGEETVTGSGRIRAEQDRGPVSVGVGDLGEGLVEDGDVVGGGVRAGPALAQHTGEGLAGVVQETQQRVEPEGLLPGAGRGLLLGVADHDGRVDVQDQAVDLLTSHHRLRQVATDLGVLGPGDLTGLGPGVLQLSQHRGVELRQQPPRGRVGRDRPEQGLLISQYCQVSDGLAAVGEHHGEIDRDPTRIMPALPLPQACQCLAECAGQTGRIRQVGEQSGTGMTDHAPPVPGHHDLRTCSGSLHPASAFRDGLIRTLDKPYFP